MAKKKEASPLVQLKDFEAKLSSASALPRITILRGQESWFHNRVIRLLADKATELGLEVNHHDPSDPDFDGRGLFADLRGGSLFGSAMAVIVRNTGDLLKRNGAQDSDLTALLMTYMAGTTPAGAVVIHETSLRADHRLVKAAAKAEGALFHFRRLNDATAPWAPDPRTVELVQWIRMRAAERGLKLRPEEAVFLSSAVGNDLSALESEVGTLAATGTENMLKTVGWHAGGTPWDVATKVLYEKSSTAVAAVEGLFSLGFQGKDSKRVLDPSALVAMLTTSLIKTVRQGIAVGEAKSFGMAGPQAAALAGIGGAPRTVATNLEKASSRPVREWSLMLDDLVAMERRMKTGGTVDANDFVLFTLKWRTRRRR